METDGAVQENVKLCVELKNALTQTYAIVDRLANACESLTVALDGDTKVSAKLLARRIEELHTKCERLTTGIADHDREIVRCNQTIEKCRHVYEQLLFRDKQKSGG